MWTIPLDPLKLLILLCYFCLETTSWKNCFEQYIANKSPERQTVLREIVQDLWYCTPFFMTNMRGLMWDFLLFCFVLFCWGSGFPPHPPPKYILLLLVPTPSLQSRRNLSLSLSYKLYKLKSTERARRQRQFCGCTRYALYSTSFLLL